MDAALTKVSIKITPPSRKIITKTGDFLNRSFRRLQKFKKKKPIVFAGFVMTILVADQLFLVP